MDAQHYRKLMSKYLEEAEALLEKGDYVQASEKLWGASAESVKVVAAEREIELKTHRDLWEFVAKLSIEMRDPEISKLSTSKLLRGSPPT